jgi:hypothetical protein
MNDTLRFIIEVAVRAALLLGILRLFAGKDGPFKLERALPIAILLGLLSGLLGLAIELWVFPVMLVVTVLVLRFLIPLPWGKAILATVIYIAAKIGLSYAYYALFKS